jgi:hypothetical protein
LTQELSPNLTATPQPGVSTLGSSWMVPEHGTSGRDLRPSARLSPLAGLGPSQANFPPLLRPFAGLGAVGYLLPSAGADSGVTHSPCSWGISNCRPKIGEVVLAEDGSATQHTHFFSAPDFVDASISWNNLPEVLPCRSNGQRTLMPLLLKRRRRTNESCSISAPRLLEVVVLGWTPRCIPTSRSRSSSTRTSYP